MTKHFLFDFDGTLVDSMGYWAKCMVGVLDNHGIPYPDDIVNIITPLGGAGTIAHFQKMGLDLPTEVIAAEIHEVLTPMYENVIPEKSDVTRCLKRMREMGLGLHVLTASPHKWLDPALKRLGMWELFDNIWSSDDFGTGKTNPDIYRMAAEKIGVDVSDVTFLDDNINADKAAKLSGVSVFGVYDDSSKGDTEEMKKITDFYVYDFSELLDYVEKNI